MIAGLILAAGESRRMGRDKALLSYRGRTFLETIISNLSNAGADKITVVLGHHAETIQRAVNLSTVRVVVNHDYQRGQTSSLQLGLSAAVVDAPEAVILCLVDHPAVSADVIAKLIEQFKSTHPLVLIPTHKGERGHPVVISQKLFPELLALLPVEPANSVTRKYRDVTQFVEVADRGILVDVDEPRTYERLEKG
ncbi:MAG: nucleotidyltransferase family protein [Acidobacteriota bacterium]|nr:nucleotidyltransferase family protein [Acidobacteriota bacterium]